MSFGGFKSFNVDVAGVGTGTLADVGAALQSIANGIISTAQGWSVDTAKNATTAYADQVLVGGYAMAVFLEHTSGAKLMLTMNLNSMGFDLSSVMNWEMNGTSLDGASYGGLSLCMLENGQDFNVSQITSSSFLPSNALRIFGMGQSYSSSCPTSFLYDGTLGDYFRYLVAVRGTQIIVLGRRSDWVTFNMLVVGDIFQCAQAGDTRSFGAFKPGATYSSYENGTYGMMQGKQLNTGSNAQIFAADGTLLSGRLVVGTGTSEGAAICDVDRTVCNYSYSSNARRFATIYAYMQTDTIGKGVIVDDGYKGVLNPEIVCVTYYGGGISSAGELTADALLDDGKLKYIGFGLCIGWDSSNTNNFWS